MTRIRPDNSASARTEMGLLVLSFAVVILNVAGCLAQDAADWQVKAGGRMSFEVASVKPYQGPSGPVPVSPLTRPPTLFSLGPDDAKPPGGRFYATFPVDAYIGFAYKIAAYQMADALASAPRWLHPDRYEIEAEAPGNPTKDQMRLMMQSLLAERFKLAVHFETKDLPVLALTQVETGKLGPKLLPHSEGPPCPEEKGLDTRAVYAQAKAPPDPTKEVFPPTCVAGMVRGMPDGTWFLGSRNTTMAIAVQTLYGDGHGAGEIDRPLVDQTGLKGTFDFVLEYKRANRNGRPAPVSQAPDAPPSAAAPPADDFRGTSFVEALRKQLGLKLVPTKAPMRVLVIDHIERPSEN